jgi:pilus assembly protein Flp/PilA
MGDVMLAKFKALWKDEEAATAVEYGLIIVFVALAIIAGATYLGTAINGFLKGTGDAVSAKTP